MRWLLLNGSHAYEIFVMVFVVVVKYYLLHGILTFTKSQKRLQPTNPLLLLRYLSAGTILGMGCCINGELFYFLQFQSLESVPLK